MKKRQILSVILACFCTVTVLAQNQYYGVFTGNASGLTNIPGASITGVLPQSVMPTNLSLVSESWTNLTADASHGTMTVTNGGFQYSTNVTTLGQFIGNGAGLTNLNGANITGTITANLQIYSDYSTNLDTNTFAIGALVVAKDSFTLRAGDGATLGGNPVGIRPWANVLTAQTIDSRPGEMASVSNLWGGATTVGSAGLLMNNGGGPTNWSPVFGLQSGNQGLWGLSNNAPVIFVQYGNFGSNAVIGGASGQPGKLTTTASITLISGSGGLADGVGGSTGGNGGSVPVVISAFAGNGGSGTTGGIGGNGGAAGYIKLNGGIGGNDYFGLGGGAGGFAGSLQLNGGPGSLGTASFVGQPGGVGGQITMNAGTTATLTNMPGGNGGILTANGNGTNNAGTLDFSATAKRPGGVTKVFGDTYEPVALFTLLSSAGGPVASASETSLLAGVQDGPSGWLNGGTLTNQVFEYQIDHNGRTIRWNFNGTMLVTNTQTLRLKMYFGSTVFVDTGAQTITGSTNGFWEWSGQATFEVANSASSHLIGGGRFLYFPSSGVMGGIASTNLVYQTVNVTTNNPIDCTATFGSASTLTELTGLVEILN